MPAASDRLDFAPPAPPGRWRALVLAVLAHLLLLLALTWGVNWKRDAENLAAEAELWAPTVQQAAPKAVEAPPPPPAPPEVKEQPAPPPPGPSQAEIALEQDKKRLAEEKRREAELARQKKLAEQKKQEELKKQELAKKSAEDRKRQEEQARAQARKEEDAKRLEALRQENLKRIQGLAGATGSPGASGTALGSAGPSGSYAGRIRAKVRPNIVFTDDVAGNPTAEVEVRMAPDGTITSKRIVKSSGARSWDEAVLRALDRTEVLPRDVDGRVHTPLVIEFRPKG
jgi:colicin import membrane protein